MILSISTPYASILATRADKIHAPTTRGDWCILPRHADVVLTLVPGLLTYHLGDETCAVAVNAGVLVKAGSDVTISANKAIASKHLVDLSHAVEVQFKKEEDEERRAQSALAQIEIGLIRHLLDLERADVR